MQNQEILNSSASASRIGRKVTRACVFQNYLSLVYMVVVLIVALVGVFNSVDFLDLIFNLCLIPAALMPYAAAGAFKKPTAERLAMGSHNKSLTEGLYYSTKILLPITAFLPIVAIELDVSFLLVYPVFFICVGFMLLNLFFTRVRSYTSNEKKFVNVTQFVSLIGLAGGVMLTLVYFAYCREFFGKNPTDIPVIIAAVALAIGIGVAYLYLQENIARLTFTTHTNFSHKITLIMAAVAFVFVCWGALVMYNAGIGEFAFVLFSIIGTGAMLATEILYLLFDRSICKTLDVADKSEIVSGKNDMCSPEYYQKSLEDFGIKKWSKGKIVGLLCAIIGIRIVADNVVGTVANSIKIAKDNAILAAGGRLNGEKTLVPGNGLVALLLTAAVVILLVFLMMRVNRLLRKEIPTDKMRIEGLIVGIALVFACVIPIVFTVGGIFDTEQLYMLFDVLTSIAMFVFTYYYFGTFMLRKLGVSSKSRNVLPTVFFVVCEAVVTAAGFGIAQLFAILPKMSVFAPILKDVGLVNAWTKLDLAAEMSGLESIKIFAGIPGMIRGYVCVAIIIVFIAVATFVAGMIYKATQNIALGILPAVLIANMASLFTAMPVAFNMIYAIIGFVALIVAGVFACKAASKNELPIQNDD